MHHHDITIPDNVRAYIDREVADSVTPRTSAMRAYQIRKHKRHQLEEAYRRAAYGQHDDDIILVTGIRHKDLRALRDMIPTAS